MEDNFLENVHVPNRTTAIILTFSFTFVAIGGAIIAQCNSALADAGHPLDPVKLSMGFCDELLGRELTIRTITRFRTGRNAFDNRLMPSDSEKYENEARCFLSIDRRAMAYSTVDSSASIRGLLLGKRLITAGFKRAADTNVVDGFGTEPVEGGVGGNLVITGGSIWYGYLHGRHFGDLRQIESTTTWQSSSDRLNLSGTVDKWHVTFIMDRPSGGDVRRVNIKRATRVDADDTVLEASIELRDWRLESGVRFPREIVSWELEDKGDDQYTSRRYEYVLGQVSEPTTLEARFGDLFADIPDGTKVSVYDQPGIDFVWQQGEIVPKVDTARVESLKGHIFAPAPSIWRYWPIWLGAAVGVAVAGSVAYRLYCRVRAA